MNHDDEPPIPDEGDHTIIRPMPGGRRPRQGQAAPTPEAVPPPRGAPAPLPARDTGLNPLETAASALLALMPRLRNTLSHPNPAELRQQMIAEVKTFESKARQLGVDNDTLMAARYVLCTALDEMVLNTPWGSSSIWSKQSLLITFHKEAWGGERFFLLLERLMQDPAGNLHMLELMYICLALGFEGKYHVMDGGRSQVEEVRERVYRAIRMQRGEFERELSPHWRGVEDKRNPLIRLIPLWVVGALAGLILLALFITLSVLLNRASDPVFTALHEVGREQVSLLRSDFSPPQVVAAPLIEAEPVQEVEPYIPPPPPEPEPKPPCLSELLAAEVREGLVEIEERGEQSLVRIRGDGLFRSGQDKVKKDYLPVLQRVGRALTEMEGQVLVTGHTDNVPIRTLRFPSNFELSQARAASVLTLLVAATGAPGRFEAEGRSDTEPRVANDTPENRARNRRVELAVFHKGCQ